MSVVVNLIVSGICALVPSKDGKVVRVTCPRATSAQMPSSTIIPAHYPYVIIKQSNVDKKSSNETFQYPATGDPRLVWIFKSVSIAVENMPTSAITFNRKHVADKEKGGDKDSLEYAADMQRIWPKNGGIKPEYFDIKNHPDAIAARLDITSGALSGGQIYPGPTVWEFQPPATPHPVRQQLLQEVKASVALPTHVSPRLVLTEFASPRPKQTEIDLKTAGEQPIDVYIGNSPLEEILLMDTPESVHDSDHHFELYYPMFKTKAPKKPPIPTRVGAGQKVHGGSGDCIPLMAQER